MEIKIENKTLLPILTSVAKVINTKNPISIMKDFLFRCKDGVVTVMATDGECAITMNVPILSVDGDGEFCIDNKWLLGLLRKMGARMVTISVDGDTLYVRHNSGSYDFATDSPKDFPVTPRIDTHECYYLRSEDIARGINHTLMSVCEETIRPMLCGINIDILPDSVVFVSTDTHILSKFRIGGYAFAKEANGIMPTKAARILDSILAGKGSVRLLMTDNKIEFMGEDNSFILTTPKLKGTFPNYNRVIPDPNGSSELIIDREELKSSVSRIESCSDKEYSKIQMSLNMSGVELASNNPDYRINAKESIVADVDGPCQSIAFTSSFLKCWLDVASTQKVKMNIIDPGRPILLREGEDAENTEWVSLIMPLMITQP